MDKTHWTTHRNVARLRWAFSQKYYMWVAVCVRLFLTVCVRLCVWIKGTEVPTSWPATRVLTDVQTYPKKWERKAVMKAHVRLLYVLYDLSDAATVFKGKLLSITTTLDHKKENCLNAQYLFSSYWKWQHRWLKPFTEMRFVALFVTFKAKTRP